MALAVIGALLAVLAYRRWGQMEEAMRQNRELPFSGVMLVWLRRRLSSPSCFWPRGERPGRTGSGAAAGATPFNPARATASALFSSPDMLGQLWLFWVAPLVGAALAGLVCRGFAQGTPAAAVPAAAPDAEETDEEEALLAGSGEEPGPDERKARDDEARDFFDKRGQ